MTSNHSPPDHPRDPDRLDLAEGVAGFLQHIVCVPGAQPAEFIAAGAVECLTGLLSAFSGNDAILRQFLSALSFAVISAAIPAGFPRLVLEIMENRFSFGDGFGHPRHSCLGR
jgi:hypothetical protein